MLLLNTTLLLITEISAIAIANCAEKKALRIQVITVHWENHDNSAQMSPLL